MGRTRGLPVDAPERPSIGPESDTLLVRMSRGEEATARELIAGVADAIRGDVEAMATSLDRPGFGDAPADIAAWSDELTPLVGNPLPIVICHALTSPGEAEAAARRVTRALVGAKWGLILYGRATPNALATLGRYRVSTASVQEFLGGLGERPFPRLVADLVRAAGGAPADG